MLFVLPSARSPAMSDSASASAVSPALAKASARPREARCDGPQAITLDTLDDFCARVRGVAQAAGVPV